MTWFVVFGVAVLKSRKPKPHYTAVILVPLPKLFTTVYTAAVSHGTAHGTADATLQETSKTEEDWQVLWYVTAFLQMCLIVS